MWNSFQLGVVQAVTEQQSVGIVEEMVQALQYVVWGDEAYSTSKSNRISSMASSYRNHQPVVTIMLLFQVLIWRWLRQQWRSSGCRDEFKSICCMWYVVRSRSMNSCLRGIFTKAIFHNPAKEAANFNNKKNWNQFIKIQSTLYYKMRVDSVDCSGNAVSNLVKKTSNERNAAKNLLIKSNGKLMKANYSETGGEIHRNRLMILF